MSNSTDECDFCKKFTVVTNIEYDYYEEDVDYDEEDVGISRKCCDECHKRFTSYILRSLCNHCHAYIPYDRDYYGSQKYCLDCVYRYGICIFCGIQQPVCTIQVTDDLCHVTVIDRIVNGHGDMCNDCYRNL